MKETFVTIFDSFFLPQGITLYNSLVDVKINFTLWVICIDEQTFNILNKLSLNNLKLIKLSDVETPELLSVKKDRTNREYCWTFTPFSADFVFNVDSTVGRVTYLDADLYFLRNPDNIFQEFEKSGKSVMITDHGYAPEYDQSATSGKFCVQFMIFKRNKSNDVRKWWQGECLNWCYNRFEDGKFGDQKYLDKLPELFPNDVHILERLEYALAPWNANRFPYSSAIFYHFQGLRILKKNKIDLAIYPLPKVLIDYVYKPYIKLLLESCKILEEVGLEIKPQRMKQSVYVILRYYISGVYSQLWKFKVRNLFDIKN